MSALLLLWNSAIKCQMLDVGCMHRLVKPDLNSTDD